MKSFENLRNQFVDNLLGQYQIREINNFFYMLLEKLFGWKKIDFHLNKKNIIDNKTDLFFLDVIGQLKNKVPIQYILKKTWFYGLEIELNNNVLIPRPETEQLVELIRSDNKNKYPKKIIDIGTGSGCIILALKSIFANSKCFGIDNSILAIEVAKKNADKLSLNVDFLIKDIFSYFPDEKYDLIVSNPPYIPKFESSELDTNVLNYEPYSALFVEDKNPLIYYQKVALFGSKYLNKNGKIYFEINEKYGNDVVSLLKDIGYENIILKKDFQEKNRFVYATLI